MKKISNVDSIFHDKVVLREGNSYLGFFWTRITVSGVIRDMNLEKKYAGFFVSKGAFH